MIPWEMVYHKTKKKETKKFTFTEISTKLSCMNADVITLVLKDCWYEKIESGVKTHEYREYKDYWIKRLNPLNRYKYVKFQKAYRKNAPTMIFEIKGISLLKSGLSTDLNTTKAMFDISLGKRIK